MVDIIVYLVPPVCGSDRDDCHPFFATCTDKGSGEYECECIPGYTGDGKTCIGEYQTSCSCF